MLYFFLDCGCVISFPVGSICNSLNPPPFACGLPYKDSASLHCFLMVWDCPLFSDLQPISYGNQASGPSLTPGSGKHALACDYHNTLASVLSCTYLEPPHIDIALSICGILFLELKNVHIQLLYWTVLLGMNLCPITAIRMHAFCSSSA